MGGVAPMLAAVGVGGGGANIPMLADGRGG